ncbi:MAG: amidohydrolase family protein [Candidatus Hodarchaeales archaeon]|jgi:5-methylthioadenosine/S-adenosylhomocysteine deaminase
MTDIIIKNAKAIIPMTGSINEPKILKNKSILISGSEIVEVGENISVPQGTEKIDATRKVIMPGLINSHTHLAMNLLKGYADDMELQDWLEKKVWPFETKITPEDIEFGARLGTLEAIASGTTTLNSMYHHSDREAKATIELGLRAVVGHVCFSWRKEDDYKETRRIIDTLHQSSNDLIRCSIDPHTGYTVDYDFLIELVTLKNAYQEKYDNPPFIHSHAAETKYETQQIRDFLRNQGYESLSERVESPIQYFHECGVLKNACIAHGIWLSEKDIQLIKQDNARIASTPISNLKLSSGIAPVKILADNGITVGFGTDSSSSNNTLDMFETMKIGSLLQKIHVEYDPRAIPAYQALWIGTQGSACAIHWNDSIGSLEIGKKADIIMVDFQAPHLMPVWNEISHLVYATKGNDVSDVIINGELVYHKRKFLRIDFDKFSEEANEHIQGLQNRVTQ